MFMHGKFEFMQAGETSEGLLKDEKREKNNLGRPTIKVLLLLTWLNRYYCGSI